MIKLRSGILLFLIFSLAAIAVPHAVAGDASARQPVAEVLGRTVYAEELVQPAMVEG